MFKVTYEFYGRHREYLVNPMGTGVYNNIEDYRAELIKYFPNATVEEVPAEIIEIEIL